MNIENRRYCPSCDDNTLVLRSGQHGWFYGCMNLNGPQKCKFSQAKDSPALFRENSAPLDGSESQAIFTPPPIEPSQNQIDMQAGADIIRAQAEKDIPHLIDIPYGDLTQEQRDEKAAYWTSKMPKSVFHAMPYDQNDRSGR